ncbi:MAG TPA: class I SAM-dependent methyltransferase [Actinomycetota bacterium]|nr:class I SAM-dependent methyltransferase [Actinomycetota bacterium]
MSSAPSETERVRTIWDRLSSSFDRRVGFFERVLFEGGREWVCSRARGDTLEIAVGTGRNLAFYSPDVRLTGIELSPAMLDVARERAARLRMEPDLRVGDAQALEFPDESFDTVTCTISLCSIPDDRAAVREVRRVLRPGGRFVMMEHVRSPVLPVYAVQRAIER